MKITELLKFVMCTLVSRVHMTFYVLIKGYTVPENQDTRKNLTRSNILDLVKFVICTLVSRNCVPFYKYIKRHVYSGNQGIHEKLNQNHIQCVKLLSFAKLLHLKIIKMSFDCSKTRIDTIDKGPKSQ